MISIPRTIRIAAPIALLISGMIEVHADEADIINACRRYLIAESSEQKILEAQIRKFDGDVEDVIQVLSRPVVTERQDVAGVLSDQSFTDPKLQAEYPDDMLHFFVPDAYQPSQPFGLLVFMHGGGSKTPREHAASVATHPDDDSQSYGLQPYFKDMPYIIVAPSAPWNEKTGARWNVPEADDYIKAVIQECHFRFNIDRDRVFLGGYSMGAFGAYHLCQRLSDQLAGAVIFSGAWKTMCWKAWTGLPVYFRHGVSDAQARDSNGEPGRPRFTDVFYTRTATQRLSEVGVEHVFVEDEGGHSLRHASESLSRLPTWMNKQQRNSFAPHVVTVSPRGWKASTDTPTPHAHWVTIHEIGSNNIPFESVTLDGPRPKFRESKEAFDKQIFRLVPIQVAAGMVDAKIENQHRIVIQTINVKCFSIWLHPAMVDFSSPLHLLVNGKETEYTVEENLLDALRSYKRRNDWGLIYHAEIKVNCEE